MSQLDNALPYDGSMKNVNIPLNTGLVVRNCIELLQARDEMQRKGINVTINAQFIEIYEEQVAIFYMYCILLHCIVIYSIVLYYIICILLYCMVNQLIICDH